jgi:hypothetical protein
VIKSRGMKWVGHEACMRDMRNEYKILVGNLKRPLGRPRSRWENVRMDVREVGRNMWTR